MNPLGFVSLARKLKDWINLTPWITSPRGKKLWAAEIQSQQISQTLFFSGSCPAVQGTGSSPRCLSPFCDGDKCQTTHSQAREHLWCLGNRAPREQPARGQGMVLFPSRHSFWRGVAKIHSSGSMWGLVLPTLPCGDSGGSVAKLQSPRFQAR